MAKRGSQEQPTKEGGDGLTYNLSVDQEAKQLKPRIETMCQERGINCPSLRAIKKAVKQIREQDKSVSKACIGHIEPQDILDQLGLI